MNNLSEYQQTKIKINELEKQLEDSFNLMTKNQQIVVNRCLDYGERSIVLQLYFDEINLQSFNQENIDNIKRLLIEYKNLRVQQKKLENKAMEEASTMRQNLRLPGFGI